MIVFDRYALGHCCLLYDRRRLSDGGLNAWVDMVETAGVMGAFAVRAGGGGDGGVRLV